MVRQAGYRETLERMQDDTGGVAISGMEAVLGDSHQSSSGAAVDLLLYRAERKPFPP